MMTKSKFFEGITEIRGGLSKGHVEPLINRISMQISYV